MKLGYCCNWFQSLQLQSARFLPPDPQHPGDIHHKLIPGGCLPSAADGLCFPASHLALTAWRSTFGLLSLEGNREGWGKREKGLFLSPGKQKDEGQDSSVHHGLASSGLSLLLVLVIPPHGMRCSLSQALEERRGGQQLLGLPAWQGPHQCDVLLLTLLVGNVCPRCWIDLELEAENQNCWNAQQRKHWAQGIYRTWPFCSVAVQHLAQGRAGQWWRIWEDRAV